MEIQPEDLKQLEYTYSQRDLTMILLGGKIIAETLASEYDDDKTCEVIIKDLIDLSKAPTEKGYDAEYLLNTINKIQ